MDTGKLAIDCMQSRSGIEKLVKQKLAAAKCLLENGHCDDAYYLAGHSIELSLKAVICKTLGVDNFFEFGSLSRIENYRVFKSHNYKDLFVLSGINTEFEAAVNEDPHLADNWDNVVKWDEGTRYKCNYDPDSVKKFIDSSERVNRVEAHYFHDGYYHCKEHEILVYDDLYDPHLNYYSI